MYTFLMVLFVILSALLAIVILIQPGKGDMGLGSIGSGSQILFGGSGGRSFFEKVTWVMATLFILGALGLSLIKSNERQYSSLSGFKADTSSTTKQTSLPISSAPVNSVPEESTDEE
ncbi:MAG: preprotein translocase subunit SecG [Candidatus Babeliales bacterium]|nr:MAG: Protein-export membrane protein secG [candidate division TM6 bacterium GW2011_GWF2_36_6]